MLDFLTKKPVVLKDDSREIANLKEQIIQLQDKNAADRKEDAIAKKELESEHKIELAEAEAEHKVALKEKEFEIKTKTADDVIRLTAENVELAKQLAVANETIKQLDRIIDLDADIVDVKDLVTKLINKLPNVNIGGNLTAAAAPKEDKKS